MSDDEVKSCRSDILSKEDKGGLCAAFEDVPDTAVCPCDFSSLPDGYAVPSANPGTHFGTFDFTGLTPYFALPGRDQFSPGVVAVGNLDRNRLGDLYCDNRVERELLSDPDTIEKCYNDLRALIIANKPDDQFLCALYL